MSLCYAKSLQSCPTLCDPIDGNQQGSSIPGILPGKNTGVGCHFLLQCMKVKSESEVAQLCPTPWTAAYQAPPKGLQLFISEKIKANARYLAGTFLVADTMY